MYPVLLGRMTTTREAPRGDVTSFACGSFTHAGTTHPVYRKGSGPAVLVLAELPGLTPHVLGFADRVAAVGCSVALPQLFGTPGRDGYAGNPLASQLYRLNSATRACISREFTVLASGRSSPVVDWLRALAAEEHARCKGPGVGVVGMCFTGGFALAMAADARVLAPVLSQPSLPLPIGAERRRSIDCEPATLERVASRCASEGLRVLGLRFHGDPLSPGERFDFLRERLGDGFVAVELSQADRHPNGPLPKAHSVLTGDLIDEPGQPTRAALDRVLELLRSKLLQA
jgi:dienelactone hydrolase